jgi:uncharacterized protein (TIGR02594 family)
MRFRIGMVVALACSATLTIGNPAFARPSPKHHQLQHKKPAAVKQQNRETATSRPQLATVGAVPALVAEARRYIGTNPTDRKRLWCARFMNFVLAKLGYAGTDSDAAKSFAYYGRRISEPRVGAIAVLSRGRNGGHVGVVSGIDAKGDPIIISGNHTRTGVGEGVYARSRVIAYVLPTERRATAVAQNGARSSSGPDLDSPIAELIAAIQSERAKPARAEARAPAPRQAVAPAVPHRTVQQTPEAPPSSGRADNPFSELIGALERTPAPAPQRRVL